MWKRRQHDIERQRRQGLRVDIDNEVERTEGHIQYIDFREQLSTLDKLAALLIQQQPLPDFATILRQPIDNKSATEEDGAVNRQGQFPDDKRIADTTIPASAEANQDGRKWAAPPAPRQQLAGRQPFQSPELAPELRPVHRQITGDEVEVRPNDTFEFTCSAPLSAGQTIGQN